jgi:hypothetical protein
MVTPNTEGLSQSSIEIKSTAKGEQQVNVKIYQNADNTIDLPSASVEAMKNTHAQLRANGYKVAGE